PATPPGTSLPQSLGPDMAFLARRGPPTCAFCALEVASNAARDVTPTEFGTGYGVPGKARATDVCVLCTRGGQQRRQGRHSRFQTKAVGGSRPQSLIHPRSLLTDYPTRSIGDRDRYLVET